MGPVREQRFETPDGELTLVVFRQENEITLGFDGCQWHTHGDILYVYAGVRPDSPPERATKEFLSALTNDRLAIVVVRVHGHLRDAWVLDHLSEVPRAEGGESIHTRYWTRAGA